MRRLLSLHAETFVPAKLKIEELIPKNAMGQRNSIHNLQNYVVGTGSAGLVLKGDGSLDVERSFVRINYFDLLKRQTVRNNVQPGVSNAPIDFLATRIPARVAQFIAVGRLAAGWRSNWLYGGPDRQVLILSRGEGNGQLHLRYLPIANLTQNEQGTIRSSALIGGPTCRCVSSKMPGGHNGGIARRGLTIGTPTSSLARPARDAIL